MISSINDKIRNKVFNEEDLLRVFEQLESINVYDNKSIVQLFISDYFKISFMESVSRHNFKIDDRIDYLVNEFFESDMFFIDVLINCKKFYELPVLTKIILMEEINNYDKEQMFLNISKTHILDKISYNFNYDLDDFKLYYKNYIEKTQDSGIIKGASVSISNKLMNYNKTNPVEYKKIILEYMLIYYKWTLYIRNNLDKNNLYNEDYLYLEVIKNASINELFKYIDSDINFLYTVVENGLYYSTIYTAISENIIEDYYNKNVPEKVKQKLKIK